MPTADFIMPTSELTMPTVGMDKFFAGMGKFAVGMAKFALRRDIPIWAVSGRVVLGPPQTLRGPGGVRNCPGPLGPKELKFFKGFVVSSKIGWIKNNCVIVMT